MELHTISVDLGKTVSISWRSTCAARSDYSTIRWAAGNSVITPSSALVTFAIQPMEVRMRVGGTEER